MDRYQLGVFELSRNERSGDLLLLLAGSTLYKSVFSRAFPDLRFSRTFEDRSGEFDWGTYIKRADEEDEEAIAQFCELLQTVILIDDDLKETFSLGFHGRMSSSGRYERTELGQLMRDAKPYNQGQSPGSRRKGEELAERMVQFIQAHPTYEDADLIVAVPPSNPDKPFDLPTFLVEKIAEQTGHTVATRSLRKTRSTRPMKECQTIPEKLDNIRDAFEADEAVFEGKSVIIIDDIYQSGFSMNEVGRVLDEAGADMVLGLVATKTFQDLSEDM